MKRCPTCNRTYPDDALSFCLEDGVTLLPVSSAAPPAGGSGFDPNATLVLPETRDTEPPATQILGPEQIPQMPYTPPVASPPPAQPWTPPQQTAPPAWTPPQQTAPPAWTPPQQTAPPVQPWPQQPPPPAAPQAMPTPPAAPQTAPPSAPPTPAPAPKKSALPWIAIGGGILILLVLGVVGILGIAAYMSSDNENSAKASPTPAAGPKKNGANTNSTGPSDSSAPTKDDFSEESWPTGTGGAYQDGEYVMEFDVRDQIVINYAPDDAKYSTNNATKVKVAAHSLDAKGQQFGYGLVVHGQLTTGQQLNGYVFIVDAKKKLYSIAIFNKGQYSYLAQDKSAPMVYDGTASNDLEVRLNGSKMDFYVNGELAGSADKKVALQGGVGFFTSYGGPVAFDNLEIVR